MIARVSESAMREQLRELGFRPAAIDEAVSRELGRATAIAAPVTSPPARPPPRRRG